MANHHCSIVLGSPPSTSSTFLHLYTLNQSPTHTTGYARSLPSLTLDFVAEGYHSKAEWEGDESYIRALIDASFGGASSCSFTCIFSKDSAISKRLVVDALLPTLNMWYRRVPVLLIAVGTTDLGEETLQAAQNLDVFQYLEFASMDIQQQDMEALDQTYTAMHVSSPDSHLPSILQSSSFLPSSLRRSPLRPVNGHLTSSSSSSSPSPSPAKNFKSKVDVPSSSFPDPRHMTTDELMARLNQSDEHNATAPKSVPTTEVVTASVTPVAVAPQSSSADVGVGFALFPREDGSLEVVGLAPGGGAELSGEIQVGDIIEKVEDRSVRGWSVADLGPLLKGAAGTVVRVCVRRQGDSTTRDLELVRIPVPLNYHHKITGSSSSSASNEKQNRSESNNNNDNTVTNNSSNNNSINSSRSGEEGGDGESDMCGVGIALKKDSNGRPVVSSIADGSPAHISGQIEPLDFIVSVDGHDVRHATLKTLASLVVGPRGTLVRIGIERGNQPSVEIAMVRAPLPKNVPEKKK